MFDPSRREVPSHFNLWRGFSVEPRPGDCSKFLAHLHDNVCRGDEALYNWVVGWMADIVQHPAKKIGTSLVLRGPHGVGKTKVGEVFGSLLGAHYRWFPIRASSLAGSMRIWCLASCCIAMRRSGPATTRRKAS